MDLQTPDTLVRLAWLVGAAMFVIGLMRMNSPATARNGNLLSAAGMTVATSRPTTFPPRTNSTYRSALGVWPTPGFGSSAVRRT